MAFEENNFYVARKYELVKSEFAVECNILAGMPVVSVLSISLEGCVQSEETLNGVLNYSGIVDAKLVFLSDDNQINTICCACPFSSKFEGENITTGQSALIDLKVVDYNIESISGDSVKLSVTLNQGGFVIANKEVRTIRNDDDDVCCREDEISIIRYVGSATENIEVSSEINVREKIKKIILTESKAIVKSVESGSNFVTISGDVISRVLYLNENDKFESGYINDSFKEELELEGATRESFVDGKAFVKQDGVSTEIVEDEKGCKIVVKSPLVLSARAYQEEKVAVIRDLYSTKNEIKVTTESFEVSTVCPMELVEGKIEGNLLLDEDKPRVDKIMFCGGNNIIVTNSYVREGEVFVEGIAKTTVVYLNDETNSLHSVQVDVPFTISDKVNFPEEGVISVDAIVCDVDVVVKKGRDLYYDAKVKACVNYCYDNHAGVITEATIGEEYPEKDYAMEVAFAHAGDELWEVAKKLCIKEEQLLAQNPNVIFPLAEDSSLILFYQKV